MFLSLFLQLIMSLHLCLLLLQCCLDRLMSTLIFPLILFVQVLSCFFFCFSHILPCLLGGPTLLVTKVLLLSLQPSLMLFSFPAVFFLFSLIIFSFSLYFLSNTLKGSFLVGVLAWWSLSCTSLCCIYICIYISDVVIIKLFCLRIVQDFVSFFYQYELFTLFSFIAYLL